MQPTVLFYNLDGTKGKKLRMLCMQQRLKVRTVHPSEFEKTLGDLLTSPPTEEEQAALPAFDQEMLVLAGIYGTRLDLLLKGMRRNKLFVALKAVLTQENAGWSSVTLCQELAKEHQKIQESKQEK